MSTFLHNTTFLSSYPDLVLDIIVLMFSLCLCGYVHMYVCRCVCTWPMWKPKVDVCYLLRSLFTLCFETGSHISHKLIDLVRMGLPVYSSPIEHICVLSKSEYITQCCLCLFPIPGSGFWVLIVFLSWGVPSALALSSDLSTSPVDPFSLFVYQKMTRVIKPTVSFLLYWESLWKVSDFC